MTDSPKFHLHDAVGGAAITVRVIPHADRNRIVEVLSDGTITVHLKVKDAGKPANQALLNFLSGLLGVSANQMEIVAGTASGDKLITVTNIDAVTVQDRILKNVG